MLFIGTASFWLLTVTLFIYYLEDNPGVLDSNYPGVHRVVHHTENLSIKCDNQKLYIMLAFAFSGQQWTELSTEKLKNSVSGELIKISISVLNFSTKSDNKQQFMTCCSSLQFILLKMTISIFLKWEISTITVILRKP